MKPKTILILAVALALAGVLVAQAQELLFGTWKQNVAKSKESPGPASKSGTAKWEAYQGAVKLTVDNVTGTGETQHYEVIGKFDGKDNPSKGNPYGDTTAFSKIDARTYETVAKNGGKITVTSRIVVAADGKTRITTQTGKNLKGETVNNTLIYEKHDFNARPQNKPSTAGIGIGTIVIRMFSRHWHRTGRSPTLKSSRATPRS